MAPSMDFSFNNQLINSYFNGDNSYAPTTELLYAHAHPLIKQSFLVELELLINKATELLVAKNVKGDILNKFINSTIAIGLELPSLTNENALKVLVELRAVYQLCNGLLKQYGVS
jgi:hypothetical protein